MTDDVLAGDAPEKDKDSKRYHHGALREALLDAAEAELTEAGIESFSLRKVARRAGVSHAAPAHHFGDVSGLLTALTARGYCKFLALMKDAEGNSPDPRERAVGGSLGYIRFAAEENALFRLLFASSQPNKEDPEMQRDAQAAFEHLTDTIENITGQSPQTDPASMMDTMAIWAMAHGLADLLSSGRLMSLQEMEPEARNEALRAIITRALPQSPDQ